jgi:hypothetical protein
MWLQLVYRCLPSLSEHCNYMRSRPHGLRRGAHDFARVRSTPLGCGASKSAILSKPLSIAVGAGRHRRHHLTGLYRLFVEHAGKIRVEAFVITDQTDIASRERRN